MTDDVLAKFEKQFESLKKELKFKTTLDELDEVFFIRDAVLKEGYVSTYPILQISRRIIDTFGSWVQYFHGVIMPNPNSLVNMGEAQTFSEEDKYTMQSLLNSIMMFSSQYNLAVIGEDKGVQKDFIDDSMVFWKKELNPALQKFMKKSIKAWKERSQEKPQKKQNDKDSLFG